MNDTVTADEDFVPCVFCEQRVDPYFARCTDSGWVCDDCAENLS
jgi:hypothetical protein